VHLALAPSGVPAGAEVWFVGDTAVDMECARNTGCVPVLLAEEMPPEAFAREFASFAPDLSFRDEAGLFRRLRGLRFGATQPCS
jgi:phosphoglycolate phosphatase